MSTNTSDLISINVVFNASLDDSQVQEQTKEKSDKALAGDLLGGDEKVVTREEALENFEGFLKDLDNQGLANLKGLMKNPGGLVQNELLGILGKAGIYGAVAVAIIGLILESPDLVAGVVKALGQRGGPINQDYERQLAEENQLGITRDLQLRRAIGLDVVITSDFRGYILPDPYFVTSNLVNGEQSRVARNGSNEVQYGYVNGI